MATLPVPSDTFNNAVWTRQRDDRQLPFLSGRRQTIRNQTDDWMVQISLPPMMDNAVARAWWLFVLQASDLANDFLLSPPDHKDPGTGYAGPGPLVKGAGQLGSVLVCDGVTANSAVISAGHYLSINNELNMATADATSDGAGTVSFNLLRNLRTAPANNAAIDIFNPKGLFQFSESKATLTLDLMLLRGMSFTAIEKRV